MISVDNYETFLINSHDIRVKEFNSGDGKSGKASIKRSVVELSKYIGLSSYVL